MTKRSPEIEKYRGWAMMIGDPYDIEELLLDKLAKVRAEGFRDGMKRQREITDSLSNI